MAINITRARTTRPTSGPTYEMEFDLVLSYDCIHSAAQRLSQFGNLTHCQNANKWHSSAWNNLPMLFCYCYCCSFVRFNLLKTNLRTLWNSLTKSAARILHKFELMAFRFASNKSNFSVLRIERAITPKICIHTHTVHSASQAFIIRIVYILFYLFFPSSNTY